MSAVDFVFCPTCGERLVTRITDKEKRPHCNACDKTYYRNPTVGVAVILLEETRILMIRRRGSYAGQWCIPCGHVEWGEDIRAAAGREFKEETGIEVQTGPVLAAYSNFHDLTAQTAGIWFWGTRIGGDPRAGSDATMVAFHPLSNLPQEMAFPTDLLVCDSLKKGIASGALYRWLYSAQEMDERKDLGNPLK
jgi:8-oxo-dGTP diphosphatase